MRREAVGSQITAASSFLARKPLVITSMLWFRYSDGLMLRRLNTACAKRSVQLPFGTATVLPSSHLSASSGDLNCGRIGAHEKDVALVVAEAEHRHDADVANIGVAGGHDAGMSPT